MSTLHLIGGGPGALLATRRHVKRALASCATPKPLVAYIGAASNDNVAFQKLMAGLFLGTGARLEPARLMQRGASLGAARQLVADCDLIFLSGGDVHAGMRLLDERGLSADLRARASAGAPVVGISAGSIMAGRGWVAFPGDDEARAELFACLGLAPLYLDTHSEDDGWSELKVLLRLAATKEGAAEGYGVPSAGCLEVTTAEGASRLRAHGDAVTRLVANAGAAPAPGAPLQPE